MTELAPDEYSIILTELKLGCITQDCRGADDFVRVTHETAVAPSIRALD